MRGKREGEERGRGKNNLFSRGGATTKDFFCVVFAQKKKFFFLF